MILNVKRKRWIPLTLLSLTFAAHAKTGVFQPVDETLLNTKAATTFAIIGDYGQDNSDEKKVAELVAARNPQFVITLGDNNYNNGCWKTIDNNIGKYYSNFIGNYKGDYGQGAIENSFFPSIGNHDWRALDECLYKGKLPYLAYFTLPNNGLYYDFKKGPIHFFVVDSDRHEPDGNTKGSRQYAWLKKSLKESTSCFKVVYFHHPAYSSGSHGSEKDLQWKFHELGADIVLSGHDHDYERIMRDGIAYFVNGVGGAELKDFKSKVKGSAYRYNKKYGYMMGYADGNDLTFVFYNTDNTKKDGIKYTKACT